MNWIRAWLAVPAFDDDFQAFTFRVLHYALLILIAVAAGFPLFATSTAQLIFLPVLLFLLGGCYWLLHTGRQQLASILFLCGLWLIITIASYSINGIRNASFPTYVVIIIFSALLVSSRAVLFATSISIASAVVLVLGELASVLPLRTTELFIADRLFQSIALFATAGVLLYGASQVIRSGIARIREHEQTLIERNRELEVEIAERHRIEDVLRASEERYRILFENTSLMCAVYDRDGTIQLANRAAAEFFGTTAQALQGQPAEALLSEADTERLLRRHSRVLDSGQMETSEGQTILRNGREIYYLRQVVPLPPADEDQPASQVLVITSDLTEQKRMAQREHELALAQEKNAFLTDFLSTISHDLKTPLTVIMTSLELLERSPDEGYREKKIEQLKWQALLLDKYIQDMLTISRLEHLPVLDAQPLNLNALIEEVLQSLRPRAENKQIICHFNPQPDLPPIVADDEQIRRMLTNLIENAINYTPAQGQVAVATRFDAGRVLVEIADSGIGIKVEDIPHIFDRFYRAKDARSFARSGTGLGLAIVKKIVEMHAGRIDVVSAPGKGTTFRVLLPDQPVVNGS